MIVKNEELTLASCLNSAKDVVDEIVIVDTGSTDRTKSIAAAFTDKIFDFEWVNDFSAARNFSFEKATKDYILWLDADDILLKGDVERIAKLKETLSQDTAVVMLKYNTGFDAQGNVNFSFFRERIVKRSLKFKWQEPVHEYIATYGKTIRADACVTHTQKLRKTSTRNLKIYQNLVKNKVELSPRATYYFARELRDAGKFRQAARYFERFLKDGQGWVEDNIGACSALFECYRQLGDNQKALTSLARSFEYDNPRPSVCCQLAYFFKEQRKFVQAIFWFELALEAGKNFEGAGFVQKDYLGYVPSLELAVCYHCVANKDKAREYNELAGTFKPNCPIVKSNREYFESLAKDS